MKNIGTYKVYLTGSKKTIKRAIYEQDGKTFCKWYGQMIEVLKGTNDYYTVEQY